MSLGNACYNELGRQIPRRVGVGGGECDHVTGTGCLSYRVTVVKSRETLNYVVQSAEK